MGFPQIKVTANRSDTEPHRLERLHQVIGYLCALSEASGYDALSRVSALHDHKGILTVRWKVNPTEADKAMAGQAWGSGTIGDGASDNVEHEVD